jgi:hypothetical protein
VSARFLFAASLAIVATMLIPPAAGGLGSWDGGALVLSPDRTIGPLHLGTPIGPMSPGGAHPRTDASIAGSGPAIPSTQGAPRPSVGFPRTVLVEAFTAVWCIHCPAESQALFDIDHNTSRSSVDIAELHVCAFTAGQGPCLENYIPADNTSTIRAAYYNVCGYPDIFFDGAHPACGASNNASQMVSQYTQAIANASAIPGNVSIAQDPRYTSANVMNFLGITSAVTGSFQAITYLAEYLGLQNVSNGYGPHDLGWVVRETLVNQSISLVAGAVTYLRGSGPLNSSWNVSNLSVITLVQDPATKVIENTNMSSVTNPIAARLNVTFEQTGLANGTPWSATLNGTQVNSTGPEITFPSLLERSYNFSAQAAGYVAEINGSNRSTGIITVSGLNVTVRVDFHRQIYRLTFQETGLPMGLGWGVFVGDQSETSLTSNLSFLEPNGSYSYVVVSVSGYVASYREPAVVNGSATVVPISFQPQTFPVVFVEFGLPTGSNWSVTVSNASLGFNETKSSTTSSITFFLANGTYAIFYTLPTGFTANTTSIVFLVAGSATAGPVVHAQGPPGPPAATPSQNVATPFLSLSGLDWFVLGIGTTIGLATLLLFVRRTFRNPPGPEP